MRVWYQIVYVVYYSEYMYSSFLFSKYLQCSSAINICIEKRATYFQNTWTSTLYIIYQNWMPYQKWQPYPSLFSQGWELLWNVESIHPPLFILGAKEPHEYICWLLCAVSTSVPIPSCPVLWTTPNTAGEGSMEEETGLLDWEVTWGNRSWRTPNILSSTSEPWNNNNNNNKPAK